MGEEERRRRSRVGPLSSVGGIGRANLYITHAVVRFSNNDRWVRGSCPHMSGKVRGRSGSSCGCERQRRVCGPAAASCPSCQADAWGRGGVPELFRGGSRRQAGGSGSRDVLVDRVQSSAAAARANKQQTEGGGGKRVRRFVVWRPVKHARVRRSGSVFSFAFFFFLSSGSGSVTVNDYYYNNMHMLLVLGPSTQPPRDERTERIDQMAATYVGNCLLFRANNW